MKKEVYDFTGHKIEQLKSPSFSFEIIYIILAAAMIAMAIMMAGCSAGSSGGGSGSTPSPQAIPPPSPAPSPTPTPSPTPAPTPSPAPCAPFVGTHWVADGAAVLTPVSQDQAGQPAYVAEFDLTIPAPMFTERQYSAGSIITCDRVFNDGVQVGSDTQSLNFTDMVGFCGAVAPWFQFDTSVCNRMTVIIRTGAGIVYETQDYIPQ